MNERMHMPTLHMHIPDNIGPGPEPKEKQPLWRGHPLRPALPHCPPFVYTGMVIIEEHRKQSLPKGLLHVQKMVETKAAKRKGAKKVARRASHELKAEAKKAGKDAEEKKKAASGRGSNAAQVDDKEMQSALMQGSDEESDSESEGSGIEKQRLVVKLDSAAKQRLTKGLKEIAAKPTEPEDPGQSTVVYLGRVPFGFFEDQMRAYFSQFGVVKRLRLSRNKKTGKSKHFAFIEFEHAEVAEIVASTHDNMLMCDRAIKCSIVPKNKQHPKMWRGADEKFVPHNFKYAAKEAANGKKTAEQERTRLKRLVKSERKKRKKLDTLGIELDFKGYAGLLAESKPKRMKFSE